MAVPASERGQSKFQVLLDTRSLVLHTLRITANEKIFHEKYQVSVVSDVVETAKNIHVNASLANTIRVSDSDSGRYRLALQQQAVLDCARLVQLIQICYSLYHLPTRRVRYWGNLCLTARDSLRVWHVSDKKRYKEFL